MMIVWMLLPPGDVILGKQHWQCCLDERAGLALLKSPEIIETIEITRNRLSPPFIFRVNVVENRILFKILANIFLGKVLVTVADL